ncbi:hypothetical protein M3M33_16470, partial [Loigolactobacillus coryniformis]|uniref:hypothetical protein n=1 Tax=Loigolactobacillus coryniformis TaxID=1610 RepID=UPI00201AA1D3
PVRAWAAWHPEKGPNLRSVGATNEDASVLHSISNVEAFVPEGWRIVPVEIVPVEDSDQK